MTLQDQYISTFTKTQETWAAAVESLTDNVKKAFESAGTPFADVDPNAAIDQVFDFWEKTLGAQREAAKQFVAATVVAGEKVRTQAESVGAALKEQAESIQKTVSPSTASSTSTAAKK